MSFTSISSLFFFMPFSIGGYYLLLALENKFSAVKRIRPKDLFTLLCSIAFYSISGVKSCCVLGAFILLSYVSALLMSRLKDKARRAVCTAAVTSVVAVLFLSKYLTYLSEFFSGGSLSLGFISALGISFVSFSSVSYIVDSYRGHNEHPSFLDTMLYLTFFPKLVSGPIVLWRDFSSNLERRTHSTEAFTRGLNLVIIGLAKKLIIADTLGALVARLDANYAGGIDTLTAWGLLVAYALQIYFDFSGYSDTALGLCRIFGFNFDANFNFPYTSLSITEFWRRWHISLGRWFREYLYIPLGGNRRGKARTMINLSIVFIVTGMWHGSGFGYLTWGCMHGAVMLIERSIKDTKLYQKTPSAIKWGCTMLVVSLGWQFFRFGSFAKAVRFWALLLGISDGSDIFASFGYYFTPKILILCAVGIIGALFFAKKPFTSIAQRFYTSPALYAVGQTLLLVLFALSVIFMINSTYSPFIYFQY